MQSARHSSRRLRVCLGQHDHFTDAINDGRRPEDGLIERLNVQEILYKPHEHEAYARLVREWIIGAGLQASIIYNATRNPREVQILFGHAKIEGKVRYLAPDVEDALELSGRTEGCRERVALWPVIPGANVVIQNRTLVPFA